MTQPDRNIEGDIHRQVEALGPWFHNLHLPGGIQTAPGHFLGDFPSFKWRSFADRIPEDLSGQRVLDVGCNAGFYSFALAERGAEVIGIESDRRYLRQARWAQEVMDEKRVRFLEHSVYEVDRLHGSFDIVVFMGVLYHLRYPLLALDLIARLEPPLLIFQSLTFGDETVSEHAQQDVDFTSRDRLAGASWPHLAFVEQTFCNDPTNWWIPNHAAVEGMLRSAGFFVRERPAHEIYLCGFSGRGVEKVPEAAADLAVLRNARSGR